MAGLQAPAEAVEPEAVPEQTPALHPNSEPSRKRDPTSADFKDWDSHETYMHAKRRKLWNQFEGMGICKKSNIFEGVSIYVNGWTQPNAESLKEMMYVHGGKYVYNFYSKSVVTHTIASNLPNSKILKLGSSIVCKPSWIEDSVAANTLLPVDGYLLYRPQDGQKKLSFSKPIPRPHNTKCEDVVVEEEETHKASKDDDEEWVKGSSPVERHSSVSNPSRAKGAEFVNEFFTHSRLHYLSTWSTELKQFTADMLTKITPRLLRLPISASITGLNTRAIVHIDLDCFFVSVSLRSRPHLRGKPVAVTHAKLPQAPRDDVGRQERSNPDVTLEHGMTATESVLPAEQSTFNPVGSTSDVASCSYEARGAGVSNGMSVGTALKKCPDLILLPYDFKSYREVSQLFYETLLHYSAVIEAVSCDEAYLELTEYCRDFNHVAEIVEELRHEVQTKTGCAVSAGISHNMLLARMCTRVAKPDGQLYLDAKKPEGFLDTQKVRDLPGVGHAMSMKLREMGVEKCGDLKPISLNRLQTQFGTKTGKMLHSYARGVDSRELKTSTERKSVSVDINFGIRFKDFSEAETLVGNLSRELQKRAEQACVLGTQLTLKMKIRKKDAPLEPWKFLGHGACDNVSRSLSLLQPSREAAECGRLAVKLLKQLDPSAADIRGVGLQLSKLVSLESGGSGGGGGSGDLRTILLKGGNGEESETASSDCVSAIESKRLTPQKSAKGRGKLKFSPGKRLKKSPAKSPGKVWPKLQSPAKVWTKSQTKSSSSKSLRHFLESSSPLVDDSFVIDLPPASQLDDSVLAALPSSMCKMILEGYATKGNSRPLDTAVDNNHNRLLEEPGRGVVMGVAAAPVPRIEEKPTQMTWKHKADEIAVKDERVFLMSWKKYIYKSSLSFPDGPDGEDSQTTADYLSKLAETNLEMTELCLKSLRRFVELRLCVPGWISAFNMILEQVQERITEFYGGDLKMLSLPE